MSQTVVHENAWTLHRDLWNQPATTGVYATALGMAEGGQQDRRDKALETSIATKLGVAALTNKALEGISAQAYATEFLLALEPLAHMYQAICRYAERTNTKTSAHAKSIKWDFKVGDHNIAIDLDHFRRYEAMRANLPEPEEFRRFMATFQRAVCSLPTGNRPPVPSWENLGFVKLPPGTSDALKAVHALATRLFTFSFEERVSGGYGFGNEFPAYFWILQNTPGGFADVRLARLFPPPGALEALNPQDILDLPFWRYRWQVYELWVLVLALEELEQYGFANRLSHNGKTLLEAGKHALVAARETPPRGYVHYQPTYRNGDGDTVKPDLVISAVQDMAAITPANTCLVIDAKQRKALGWLEKQRKAHFEETYAKYAAASSNAGVVILNYDTLPEQMDVPASARILGEFHPGVRDCNAKLGEILGPFLSPIWALARTQRTVLVVDASGSMRGARSAAISKLQSFLNAYGPGTPLYGTRAYEFFPISEADLTAQLTSGKVHGAECAETLCRGVLALAQQEPIDQAVFITDLAGEDLSRFMHTLQEHGCPSWLTVLSVVEGAAPASE